MAGQVVQMDYAVVGEVSNGFGVAAQTLRTVAKVLGILVQILRAMALASLGTSLALAQYLDTIQKKCENLAKISDEFSKDLKGAIEDHKRGDFQGKRYFGEGVGR
jgi:sulfite exporter TauE/SafE